MNTTLGFLSLQEYWNNAPGATAPFGELSPTARTYEKNTSEYPHVDDPKTVFYLFKHVDERDVPLAIEDDVLNVVWDVLNWVAHEVRNNKVTSNKEDFHSAITTRFNSLRYQFKTGEHEVQDGVYAPSFVQWEDPDKNVYSVWLSNVAFMGQYQGGEAQPIPLMSTPDVWFTAKANVQAELAKVTPAIIFEQGRDLEVRDDGTPVRSTSYTSISIRWYQRGDAEKTLDVEFSLIVYGVAKDNPRDIKLALRKYLLDNSNYAESEWMAVFPEIFNPVEFTLVPLWDSEAFAPSDNTGVFNPIVKMGDGVRLMDWIAVDYDKEHVKEYIEVVPTTYASISMLSCGNEENADARFSLRDEYPRYFLADDQSTDWGRIPPTTQDFIDKVNHLLYYARRVDAGTPLPNDVYRMYRNGNMYVAGKVNGQTMMIVSRMSYLKRVQDLIEQKNKAKGN